MQINQGLCEVCHERRATEEHHVFGRRRRIMVGDAIVSSDDLSLKLSVCRDCHRRSVRICRSRFTGETEVERLLMARATQWVRDNTEVAAGWWAICHFLPSKEGSLGRQYVCK